MSITYSKIQGAVFSINCSKKKSNLLLSLQLSSLNLKVNKAALKKISKYIKSNYRHTLVNRHILINIIKKKEQDIHTKFQGRRSHFDLTTNGLKSSQLSRHLRLKRVGAVSVCQVAIGAISLTVSFFLIINSNQLSKQKDNTLCSYKVFPNFVFFKAKFIILWAYNVQNS